ncbi:MAG: hypothetical protein J6A92_03505 [Lachnospiraceae bacterium]|nr:hypothetical protein [Lachnospiraceae bacterium]
MENKSKLVLITYDAQLTKLKIVPKCHKTKVSYELKIYDEKLQRKVQKKLTFKKVVAVEFHMNYFDNPIGAECCGFYEIFDKTEKEAMIERNFKIRKENFLFHGDYTYDAEDEHDLLNYREDMEKILKRLDEYHLFQQQTTGGVYSILAKKWVLQTYGY